MYVTDVHVRFFRSFNFDYERKAHPRAKLRSWELVDGQWWPFVSVALDRQITAIVGSNESGKSQLIAALKQALTGEDISRRDFCRYSPLFSVQRDRVRKPDLGLTLHLEAEDAELLREAGWERARAGQPLTIVRYGDERFCRIENEEAVDLTDPEIAALGRLLPQPLELPANVPLPDSVTFDELRGQDIRWAQGRRDRAAQRDALASVTEPTSEGVNAVADQLASTLTPYEPTGEQAAMVDLARTLIFEICEVAETTFDDLLAAHDDSLPGQLGALVRDINRLLAVKLNFARWWRQDRDFALRVSAQGDELVITVADRTGAEYAFRERSMGLRFFLGYFVRLQARAGDGTQPKLLLMDEPDAFLSSVAQGDLLRVLAHFAAPGNRPADQVVYVTHSPFMLDRNHPERIRVLDKGSDRDGTRVVADAVRNHYEPLRSSIGAAAAETAFLGGTNLIVEGPADQVLLAGANSLLRAEGRPRSQLLDLNEVTIVPAGGASQIPYTAYLARGRDELKPACVVLVDGDKAGRDAVRQLRKGMDGLRKRIVEEEFILDLADWAAHEDLKAAEHGSPIRETEDLLPIPIAVAAAHAYAQHLLGIDDVAAVGLTAEEIRQAVGPEVGVFDALRAAFASHFEGAGLSKLGLAKEVLTLLEAPPRGLRQCATHLLADLSLLIRELKQRLAKADAVEGDRRRDRKAEELVKGFLRDYDARDSTRDEANVLLRAIEDTLEGSRGDEAVGRHVATLRRTHRLDEAVLDPVEDFDAFAGSLGRIRAIRREAYR